MSNQECKQCWWQEGGRCYVEPVQRDKSGRSLKLADKICEEYTGKREVLSSVIPNEKLNILSEINNGPTNNQEQ